MSSKKTEKNDKPNKPEDKKDKSIINQLSKTIGEDKGPS